jgi:hypothetical protein
VSSPDEEALPPLSDDDPRVVLVDKLDRMVVSYLTDPEIDFARVSLMEVFTWCPARLAERWLPEDEGEEASASEGDFAAD